MRSLLAAALLFCSSAHADTSVLTYHAALNRAGTYTAPGLTYERARQMRMDPSFHAAFEGEVYAQPLLWRDPGAGRAELIVATENNEVLALDVRSGAPIWTRRLGAPVPRSALPCGNISPLGITGAPVIDPKSATLYLDAAILREGRPHHEIYAISLADGAVKPGWPVDVAAAVGRSFEARVQNQRGALALFDGKIYVPFSGHWGDCGAYRGVVVGVDADDPHKIESFSTRARGGGIWAQGGVSGDGRSLFAVTGNTFGASAWSDGEALLRLAPDLARPIAARDYFAPRDWRDLDGSDLDLGGTDALPLDIPGGRKLLFTVGKSGEAYLIDRDNLGGIGGAVASAEIATNIVIASPAVVRSDDAELVVLQGDGARCPTGHAARGLLALKIRAEPVRLETAWCGAVARAGSPIITTTDGHSDPIVWVLGAEGDNRLHAFKADNGEPIPNQLPALSGLHHFQTLIAGDDRLYVAADGRIYAFIW